jgi:hypothetical protein
MLLRVAPCLLTRFVVLPTVLQDVVRRMLVRDPTQRATAEEVLAHEWVRENGVAGDNVIEPEVRAAAAGAPAWGAGPHTRQSPRPACLLLAHTAAAVPAPQPLLSSCTPPPAHPPAAHARCSSASAALRP